MQDRYLTIPFFEEKSGEAENNEGLDMNAAEP
jgi:hypothetical protein